MHKGSVEMMMKRNLSKLLTILLALGLLVLAAACNKNSNANNSNGGNSSNTSGSTKTSSGSTTSGGMSPTEVFKAYYDASIKKDFQTAKKYLSQGTIALMEEGAKKQGKTLDEALKESPAPEGNMPQLANEQISGDTATVDVSAEGHKATMPFVKEGGEWKIAMDKFAKDMINTSNGGPSHEDGDNENANR
jgi:hypothetical protein